MEFLMKSLFSDAVFTPPSTSGESVAATNGVDIPNGQKGTGGEIPYVALVTVDGAPAPGAKIPEGNLGSTISGFRK